MRLTNSIVSFKHKLEILISKEIYVQVKSHRESGGYRRVFAKVKPRILHGYPPIEERGLV